MIFGYLSQSSVLNAESLDIYVNTNNNEYD